MTRNLDINAFVDHVVERAEATAATVLAEELVGALREVNPVDTHFSETNWLTGVGAPPEGPRGSRRSVDSGAAAAALAAVIASYHPDQGPIFISNKVKYIRRIGLPPGSSPQAPGGFVDDAIRTAIVRARARLGGQR